MQDTSKYLIHADVTADGVVERSDVVGAVFGQTEGLLGTEMDLRKLQEASKIGRIDVDVDSERGHSFGDLTIASSLDRTETAVLAAALETISRIGPCRAEVEVTGIEDIRAAKRREVVDRAKELMAESFDDSVMSTQEILEEVRRSVRVEDITEYEGLPAGPHVADSDAIIVVEGRADVLQLLQYGIKNAVAVEGTNVPQAVGELTSERTVTAFFDGDRGGDLILKELAQVGDVDYVALAPAGRSVEDLSRREVTEALREKMPYEVIAEEGQGVAATDGSVRPAPDADAGTARPSSPEDPPSPEGDAVTGEGPADGPKPGQRAEADASTVPDRNVDPENGRTGASADDDPGADATAVGAAATDGTPDSGSAGVEAGSDQVAPADVDAESVTDPDGATGSSASTLLDHARAVVGEGTGVVRLVDESFDVLAEAPAADAFEAIDGSDVGPWAVVLDGELTQRVLDVAAQRGVAQVIARETGEFVKRPTSLRIRTADQLLEVPAE
ncbi:DNA primase [Halobacteriales archaeon QS_1_68_20]|nr:MAG: DNA primase [Halobacteriales archaeon QS_1_68_20]